MSIEIFSNKYLLEKARRKLVFARMYKKTAEYYRLHLPFTPSMERSEVKALIRSHTMYAAECRKTAKETMVYLEKQTGAHYVKKGYVPPYSTKDLCGKEWACWPEARTTFLYSNKPVHINEWLGRFTIK